jgi:hypothetical protein
MTLTRAMQKTLTFHYLKAIASRIDWRRANTQETLKLLKKQRHSTAKALANLTDKPGKASALDRRINARAKGVTFRRIGGRIVPIRPKR